MPSSSAAGRLRPASTYTLGDRFPREAHCSSGWLASPSQSYWAAPARGSGWVAGLAAPVLGLGPDRAIWFPAALSAVALTCRRDLRTVWLGRLAQVHLPVGVSYRRRSRAVYELDLTPSHSRPTTVMLGQGPWCWWRRHLASRADGSSGVAHPPVAWLAVGALMTTPRPRNGAYLPSRWSPWPRRASQYGSRAAAGEPDQPVEPDRDAQRRRSRPARHVHNDDADEGRRFTGTGDHRRVGVLHESPERAQVDQY
jgi:hypothetical protein